MRTSSVLALESGSYDELLYDAVTNRFGYESLHTEQEQLIRASIEGHDVLGVLPTGRGKSACFQIPGIVTRSKTLVVSPLIALQDDQVRSLRARGIKAFAVHSGLDDIKKQAAHFYFKFAPPDEPAFLYISPEMLLTETFHHCFDGAGFTRVAVDEAHCVSTWGNTFRPDYQRIRVAVKRLHIPHCAAFTATIDPRIEQDIKKRIPLNPHFVRVVADPFRHNLLLSVENPASEDDVPQVLGSKKTARTLQLLANREYKGASIIYCSSRDAATGLYLRLRKRWQPWLARNGFTTYLFHAHLPYEDKVQALQGFQSDPNPIVIATSAFGMGIDRADVRQIIHYNLPHSLIDYAQQIGRAGRDGKWSLCTVFHSHETFLERELQRIKFELPTYDFVEQVHGWLRTRVTKMTPDDRRKYNLSSFLARQSTIIEKSAQITHKSSYLNRVMTSVGLLQRAGVIREESDGLSVFGIEPGGDTYKKLLELTKMHERMQVREKERAAQFFGTRPLDQHLLWEILSQD